MVGALDLQFGGSEFKYSSLPLDGFLFGGPRVNSSFCEWPIQLVNLPSVGNFKKFLFNGIFVCSFQCPQLAQ